MEIVINKNMKFLVKTFYNIFFFAKVITRCKTAEKNEFF